VREKKMRDKVREKQELGEPWICFYTYHDKRNEKQAMSATI